MRAEEVGLDLLGLPLVLRTDEPALAGYVRSCFARMLATPGPGGGAIEVVRQAPGRWRVRDEAIDATVERRDWLEGIVVARVLEAAGDRAPGHDLFHAAAVARNGRAMVVAAESGCGKTTLALGLRARGFELFSDEVAALRHADGAVVAFPKALELRPDTARRLGLSIDARPGPRGKALVDPGEPPAAAALGTIVFVEPPGDSTVAASHDLVRVLVHRRDEAAVAALASEEPAIASARLVGERGGFCEVEVAYRPGRAEAFRLDEVLGRRGLLIVDVPGELPPPTFDGEPGLERLGAGDAIRRLLLAFRGRKALARRLREPGEAFASLWIALAERLAGVRFWRMTTGRLERSLDRLEEAFR